jgi:multiple sugar transport system ATP-binding protein
VEELGSDAFLYGTVEGDAGDLHDVVARVDPRKPPMKGDIVHLRIREGAEHLFDLGTGKRIPIS